MSGLMCYSGATSLSKPPSFMAAASPVALVIITESNINENDNCLNTNNANMKITQKILDELTAKAKENPRLRQSLDLRNSADDQSQRMLNAIEPGSPLPIHRHRKTSETVVCLRGHLREIFYNDKGDVTDVIDLAPNSDCVALNIPMGQWHTVEVLESGTVIMEVKDGAYQPLSPDEIMEL